MPIPDRQKQRREYLWKATTIHGKRAGAGLLLKCLKMGIVCFGSATCLSLLLAMFSFSWNILFWSLLFSMLIIGCCYRTGKIARIVRQINREAQSITYVPPVTADTLPAEEVLVRGSQELIQQQSTVLLRAAENTDTPAEELLRASVRNQSEA